jgi:pimeloyl-ACP methyl ester carboxylesterase
MTLHEMQIEGHKLAALSFNPDTPGTPIILVHGITSSIASFSLRDLSLLIPRGPCYSLSLPGHYPAAFPAGFRREELTAETIARLLIAAICELVGERPVALVGHSTGGFACLDIAAHRPDLAHWVISIAGFAHGRWGGALGLNQTMVRCGVVGRRMFKLVYQVNRSSPGMHRAMLCLYVANPRALYSYPHLDAGIAGYLPYFKQLDLDAMVDYFTVMPGVDISPLLPRITAPVLALTGDSDPIVPPSHAKLIAGAVCQGDLVVVDRAGHLLFWENPDPYNHALEEWLSAR